MDETPRPPRRKRYSGRNPRHFDEKYKELRPDLHAETIGKVLASGKTPAGMHVPVLVAESLQALAPAPGETGIDATLGFGGHAREILARLSPGGHLIGLDVDPLEQPRTLERLRHLGYGEDVLSTVLSNYAGIRKVLDARGLAGVDFIFADLGCSSMQVDNPARGFTYKSDGPLDMRMNPSRGIAAAEWIARTPARRIAAALHENADEPLAEEIAETIAGRTFPTTRSLADALRALPWLAGSDPEKAESTIRRVFQAVRIEVNGEFSALDSFLRQIPYCLAPGGRVAILTFHSGEDRRVKKSFQNGLREGFYARISDGVTTAGPEERRANPRSIPAKLRWAVRA